MSNSIPTVEEIQGIVSEVNGEFYESTGNDYLYPFTFKGNGSEQMVEFMGLCVWNSVDDPRKYLFCSNGDVGVNIYGEETREDLKEFLLKEAREITIALSKFLQEEV